MFTTHLFLLFVFIGQKNQTKTRTYNILSQQRQTSAGDVVTCGVMAEGGADLEELVLNEAPARLS